MKALSFHALVAVLLFAALPCSISAQTLFWDPDGATVGTSISGNWDTATPNWTISVDSGANTAWTQGSLANFGVAANYTVTLTAPITVGGVTLTGTAGSLTLAQERLPFPLRSPVVSISPKQAPEHLLFPRQIRIPAAPP